jgi:hypothetical protein
MEGQRMCIGLSMLEITSPLTSLYYLSLVVQAKVFACNIFLSYKPLLKQPTCWVRTWSVLNLAMFQVQSVLACSVLVSI